jgi:hypothetical protein
MLGDFFQNAEPYARKSAITYVGRSLTDSEEDISNEVIEKLVTLLTRLLTQVERILKVNQSEIVTKEIVTAAKDSLVIGQG